MLKSTSALALIVAFSLMPMAQSEAGERHRIIKHQKFHMTDTSGRRDRRHVRRIVNRNVIIVKIANGRFRHHHGDRQGNTYSGDVDISVQSGVGQWSYGSYSADAVSVTVVPKAKIIDVGSLKVNSACEMQAGVCVIRP